MTYPCPDPDTALDNFSSQKGFLSVRKINSSWALTEIKRSETIWIQNEIMIVLASMADLLNGALSNQCELTRSTHKPLIFNYNLRIHAYVHTAPSHV